MKKKSRQVKNLHKNSSFYLSMIGLFSAFAIIISYLETLIPINYGIPGVKPGFANLVIVLILYLMDFKSAFLTNIIRIIVIGFMFGNVFSILFSLTGAIASLIMMFLATKIKGITMYGVSICGGVMHNIAQIIAASFLVETFSLLYYLPVLIISGIVTGLINGILSEQIYKRIQNLFTGGNKFV